MKVTLIKDPTKIKKQETKSINGHNKNIVKFKKGKKKTKCKKSAFKDKTLANTAMRLIQEKEDDRKKPVRAYQCHICNQWHLTSQE